MRHFASLHFHWWFLMDVPRLPALSETIRTLISMCACGFA